MRQADAPARPQRQGAQRPIEIHEDDTRAPWLPQSSGYKFYDVSYRLTPDGPVQSMRFRAIDDKDAAAWLWRVEFTDVPIGFYFDVVITRRTGVAPDRTALAAASS